MLGGWPLLPANLKPPVAATNAGGYDVRLPIYAIETSLGAGRVLNGARRLAKRSHVARRLRVVDRHRTYVHIDPLSALAGKNAFVKTVVPFLRRLR